MKKRTFAGTLLIVLMLVAAALAGGCGGRSGSGAVAALPPPPEARGTLKFSNVPAKTVITVDGQQIPMASGTVTVEVAPGVHVIVVSRTGYVVANSADLQAVPVAVGAVTEKTLSFTREAVPLPDGWVETAGRLAGQPGGETLPEMTQTPPLP